MFSSLTRPNYPKAGLGIEASSITAVSLQSSGKRQYALKQAATLELPPGLLIPGFSELNIVDEPEFLSYIREVTESAGLLKQRAWSITLPMNTARTAILTLEAEPASRQEAEDVFDWKAEQNFGAPAAEMRLSRFRISPDSSGRSRYFVTAIKLGVIDQYERQFEALGWRAGLILPRAVGEANWLLGEANGADSLLISSNESGFTAVLLRGGEPAVVRSVTCTPDEVEDEIYRLVMFYNDRFAAAGALERMLLVGSALVPENVRRIAVDALGRDLTILGPADLGLILPDERLRFGDLAAPAGVAALGF